MGLNVREIKTLELLTVQFDENLILPHIVKEVSQQTGFQVSIHKVDSGIDLFFSVERSQYDAGKILSEFESKSAADKVMLYTSVDLYLPIFTYVFGLAQLDGRIAIVSTHRLKNQYYGLPSDERLLKDRLLKETIHELGHLLNLRHCPNYWCVMTSSTSTDDLDVKSHQYCSVCAKAIKG